MRKIAQVLISDTGSEQNAVWVSGARSFLAGALCFHYSMKKTFLEALDDITSTPLKTTVERIMEHGGSVAKSFIGPLSEAPDATINGIGLELSELGSFCSIAAVRNMLTPRDGARPFDWNAFALARHAGIVVLDFPLHDFSVCAPLFRLIVCQMINAMQARPEREYRGRDLPPILAVLDEFPALGKLPDIASALATLRSRGLTFMLAAQSVAAIDEVYGQLGGRAIRDCLTYTVIHGAMDVESQRHFGELIGQAPALRLSASISPNITTDEEELPLSSTLNIQVEDMPALRQDLLRGLQAVVVVGPEGIFQAQKHNFSDDVASGTKRR